MPADFPQRLTERLQSPLPGSAAHRRYAPELSYGRQTGPPPDDARHAAVLMVFYPHQGGWHLPLTLRPDSMQEHAAQISLPGGLIEYGESSGTAALRELEEELGTAEGVELVGQLSPFYVFVSNIRVTPWVGFMEKRPEWSPNPAEVAELLEVPLDHLLDAANTRQATMDRRGCLYGAPYFDWQGHKIWGATSMMLNEMVELAKELAR